MSDTSHQRFHSDPLDSIKYASKGSNWVTDTNDLRTTLQKYLDNHTREELQAEIDKRKHLQMAEVRGEFIPLDQYVDSLPWWAKDKHGWPIELIEDRPMKSLFRIVFQNIRKLPFF